jgi:hypothetical protein
MLRGVEARSLNHLIPTRILGKDQGAIDPLQPAAHAELEQISHAVVPEMSRQLAGHSLLYCLPHVGVHGGKNHGPRNAGFGATFCAAAMMLKRRAKSMVGFESRSSATAASPDDSLCSANDHCLVMAHINPRLYLVVCRDQYPASFW